MKIEDLAKANKLLQDLRNTDYLLKKLIKEHMTGLRVVLECSEGFLNPRNYKSEIEYKLDGNEDNIKKVLIDNCEKQILAIKEELKKLGVEN